MADNAQELVIVLKSYGEVIDFPEAYDIQGVKARCSQAADAIEILLTEVRLAFEAGYDYGYGRGVTGETVDVKYIAGCFKDWSDNRCPDRRGSDE